MSNIHDMLLDLKAKAIAAGELAQAPWGRSATRTGVVVDNDACVLFESYGTPSALCDYVAAANPANILAIIAHIGASEQLAAESAVAILAMIVRIADLEERHGEKPSFSVSQLESVSNDVAKLAEKFTSHG